MTDRITPSFQGEVQFRRYSDTSTQGQQVVFAVADREALESFIGKEGKRFMAVLVEIGDDEQPVAGNPVTVDVGNSDNKPAERMGDLCWRAVMWCKEPEFQGWIARHAGAPDDPSEDLARRLVLGYCNVKSRKDIDGNTDATQRFHRHIRGPYQKHLMARGIK